MSTKTKQNMNYIFQGSTLRLFGSTLALSLVIHIIAVLLGAPLLE
jgi:hypothetical protein